MTAPPPGMVDPVGVALAALQASPGGGVGPAVACSPSSGTIDPTIAGFKAGIGAAGTGRLNVTLSGNTSFEGLPAGVDGQQLFIVVVSGNFTLTLLVNNGSTAQAQVLGSGALTASLDDALSLYYDAGIGKWVVTP